MRRRTQEQETVIRIGNDEKIARIWSDEPGFQRWMTSLGIQPLETAKRKDGVACSYAVHRKCIKIRSPRKYQISARSLANLRRNGQPRSVESEGKGIALQKQAA